MDDSCINVRHNTAYGEFFSPDEEMPLPLEDREGHLRAFGQQGQPRSKIEEVDGCLDAHTFTHKYVYLNRPVVMRGCQNQSKAGLISSTLAAQQLWTDEYLHERAGNHTSEHGCPNEPLSDFLDNYKTNFRYSYRICNALPPHILHDVAVLPMLRCPYFLLKLENIVMWLNSGGRRSLLHFDNNDVLLMQLDGQKHITLVDPIDSLGLYADHNPGRFGQSPIDLDRVDLGKYPRASSVRLHTAVLSKGDTFFLPSRWWHLIRSLPRRQGGGRVLSLNLQFSVSHGSPASQLESPFTHDLFSWVWRTRRDGTKWAETVCPLKENLDSEELPLHIDNVVSSTDLKGSLADFDSLFAEPETAPASIGALFEVLFSAYEPAAMRERRSNILKMLRAIPRTNADDGTSNSNNAETIMLRSCTLVSHGDATNKNGGTQGWLISLGEMWAKKVSVHDGMALGADFDCLKCGLHFEKPAAAFEYLVKSWGGNGAPPHAEFRSDPTVTQWKSAGASPKLLQRGRPTNGFDCMKVLHLAALWIHRLSRTD